MRERGFIALPAMAWAAIGAGVIIIGLGVGLKIQSARLESCKAEYATFKAEVKVNGEAAAKEAKAKEAADKSRKEKADAQNAKTRNALTIALNSLRNQRSNRSYLPTAAPGSTSPDTACLSRPIAERAIRSFVEETSGLIEEGDSAIVDLDTAKKWASKVN